jgi:DNA-binding NarL/FixJ family response regulator
MATSVRGPDADAWPAGTAASRRAGRAGPEPVGETLLAPTVTRRLIEAYTRRAPGGGTAAGAQSLTPREGEVWQLMARGLSNTEIADQLFVGEATVKTHVSRVMAKLGARDRVQAVVLAYENSML